MERPGKGNAGSPKSDAADGTEFVECGREDRHQFRFIVAPEDGDQFSDLRAFNRDVCEFELVRKRPDRAIRLGPRIPKQLTEIAHA